jgi:hypothetical protein
MCKSKWSLIARIQTIGLRTDQIQNKSQLHMSAWYMARLVLPHADSHHNDTIKRTSENRKYLLFGSRVIPLNPKTDNAHV